MTELKAKYEIRFHGYCFPIYPYCSHLHRVDPSRLMLARQCVPTLSGSGSIGQSPKTFESMLQASKKDKDRKIVTAASSMDGLYTLGSPMTCQTQPLQENSRY